MIQEIRILILIGMLGGTASSGCDGCGAWSQQFAAAGMGTAIARDGEDNVLVAGGFSGTADFGGGPLTAAGGADGAGNILLTGVLRGTVDFGTGLLDSENGSIFVTRLVP